ncbi:MmcQ/YjbR family DNA-binding protein [Phreatobacter sp. AB_2022a]|uniref:MmcQ/YjbR family DNA-binding protein n=1 Tax=Phreatobacter sp. AB_2022a TaxID=3003134 RepID=UPI002E1BEF2F
MCQSLPHTTCVVQWRGSHVWKVGGKVFAWATPGGATAGVTFKASEMTYRLLKDEPGLRPAPYMASRGLTWLQQHGEPGLPDDALADYVRHAYAMVARSLPKKVKAELGLAGA